MLQLKNRSSLLKGGSRLRDSQFSEVQARQKTALSDVGRRLHSDLRSDKRRNENKEKLDSLREQQKLAAERRCAVFFGIVSGK